ncbi:hypothetical protein ABJI51_11700 [Amycolatopsis sp. NEAU-NG30]|uniref:Secreted protein n=1 Tax=Amycolatopsis melonis TaxID=3156488 RepID=A0ABV0LBR6_9PSEU
MRTKTRKPARAAAVVGTAVALAGLSAGLTAAPAQAGTLSLCSGTASGALAKFGPVSKQCSYTSPASGWRGKLRVEWNTQSGTNQAACVEARMGKAVHPDPWQGIGCGKAGVGLVKWPANTLSNLEVRVKGSGTSLIVNVDYYI